MLPRMGEGANNRKREAALIVHRESDCLIVCAGQRLDREGLSPSGARMRGAISKGGGNVSPAGERG